MRRLIRRLLGIEPQHPAMPPEVRVTCEECGATETIQRNTRGDIVLSDRRPCVGPHASTELNTEAANQ